MPAAVQAATHLLNLLQVWSVSDQQWCCKIDEGPAGERHPGCMLCSRATLPLETSHDALPALKASPEGQQSEVCVLCVQVCSMRAGARMASTSW